MAVIIHKNRILLLKRRSLPVVINPGIWSFLSGARDGTERYLSTACREIREESGIGRESLSLLFSGKVSVTERSRNLAWTNRIFIFRSSTGKVRLDFENSGYRWATIREIENEIDYTNVFINPKRILKSIKRHVHG